MHQTLYFHRQSVIRVWAITNMIIYIRYRTDRNLKKLYMSSSKMQLDEINEIVLTRKK